MASMKKQADSSKASKMASMGIKSALPVVKGSAAPSDKPLGNEEQSWQVPRLGRKKGGRVSVTGGASKSRLDRPGGGKKAKASGFAPMANAPMAAGPGKAPPGMSDAIGGGSENVPIGAPGGFKKGGGIKRKKRAFGGGFGMNTGSEENKQLDMNQPKANAPAGMNSGTDQALKAGGYKKGGKVKRADGGPADYDTVTSEKTGGTTLVNKSNPTYANEMKASGSKTVAAAKTSLKALLDSDKKNGGRVKRADGGGIHGDPGVQGIGQVDKKRPMIDGGMSYEAYKDAQKPMIDTRGQMPAPRPDTKGQMPAPEDRKNNEADLPMEMDEGGGGAGDVLNISYRFGGKVKRADGGAVSAGGNPNVLASARAKRANGGPTLGDPVDNGAQSGMGGGPSKASKKQKGATTVNVIVAPSAPGGPPPGAMPPPPPMPPPPAAAPPPPPGGAPPPGGMPPMGAAPPMMPPPPPGGASPMGMMRKAGGRVGYPIDTGAGGGTARPDKMKAYGGKQGGPNQ
jgi:hypothetical protein